MIRPYVAREPLPTFRKLVPEVPMFQGTFPIQWELFRWLGTYWELLPSKIENLGTSFYAFPSLETSTHSWSPCWLLTTFLFPCDHTFIWLTQKNFSRKLSCNKSLFRVTLSSWCTDLYLTLVLEYSLIATLNCSYS